MIVKYFPRFWTCQDVEANSNFLFVYGDNDQKRGRGGQAIIRDLPNTIGIPTKKAPNNLPESFYYDVEYEKNIKKIDHAIDLILLESEFYDGIILPRDGFGTGLAKMKIFAPKTLEYLNGQIKKRIVHSMNH